MKMTLSTKSGIQGTSFILIAIGLIMFLSETYHAGNALETIKISLSLNTISLISAGLIILPAIMLLILHLRRNKNTSDN